MIDQASQAGLLVDAVRHASVVEGDPAPEVAWRQGLQNSLTWPWWPLELVPKWTWDKRTKTHHWQLGLWGHRQIDEGTAIDRTVLERLREPSLDYRPPSLSAPFIESVCRLDTIPMSIGYAKDGFDPSTPPLPTLALAPA
jgi:hypothetical protein